MPTPAVRDPRLPARGHLPMRAAIGSCTTSSGRPRHRAAPASRAAPPWNACPCRQPVACGPVPAVTCLRVQPRGG
eukprot:11811544-Alexandrium_andersonii.AAC.1